jgi:hypothetical protein
MCLHVRKHRILKGRSTLRLILMTPVRMDTFENSTDEKISMRSEKSFWMLVTKLESNWLGA